METRPAAVRAGETPPLVEMFAVEKEVTNIGADLDYDYTNDMNRLRDAGGVHKGSFRELLGVPEYTAGMGPARQGYTFLSYRACEIGFRENLLFSSEALNEGEGMKALGPNILSMVGKRHKQLRAPAQALFKRPKVLDWWNKRWIEQTVDDLLDRLIGQDTADLNTALCAQLPMATITHAVGLNDVDALAFRYHLYRATFGAPDLPAEASGASREIVDRMLRDLIAERARKPGDDVITGLIAARLHEHGGSTRPLSEDELFGYCKLLIFGGGTTTWRQLGIVIDALLSHYHFWEACRDDRSLIEQAVEEAIRWRSTVPAFFRLCTEDTVVEGVHVPEGARVYLCLAAANHDPRVFERPGDFDIFRRAEHNMGFGFGPHRCLGIDVARQEMVVALNGLMDRWPNLRFDPAQAKPIYRGLNARGISGLPVRLI